MNYPRGFLHFDPPPLQDINGRCGDMRAPTTAGPRPKATTLAFSPPKRQKPPKEERDPTPEMAMKQFQPAETINFRTVILGQRATRRLMLLNPSPAPQELTVFKPPSSAKGFAMSAAQICFNPMEQQSVEFSWEPQKSGACFDSVSFFTSDGHSMMVKLVGTCEAPRPDPKKKLVRRRLPNTNTTTILQPTSLKPQACPPPAMPPPTATRRGPLNRTDTIVKGKVPADQPNLDSTRTFVRSKTQERLPRKLPFEDEKLQKQKEEAERKAREEEEKRRQNQAAMIIQRTWRVVIAKKILHELKEQDRSARSIQRWWLAIQSKRAEQRQQWAALTIQHWWRAIQNRRQNQAAMIIQRAWRMAMAKKILHVLKQRYRSARSIQLWWRTVQNKLAEQRRHEAAKTIQRAWAAHRQRLIYKQQRLSALLIQCYWRGFAARKLLADLKKRDRSARSIQLWWRAVQERRQNQAAMIIQRAWRMARAKKILFEMKKQDQNARCIQRWWRAVQSKRIEQRRHEAAKTIQRAWAAHRQRLIYKQQRMSALLIQCYWRGFAARKLLADLKKRDRSARSIQLWWRAIQNKRVEQRRREAAQAIQHWWRAAQKRRRNQAAIVIQRAWRVAMAKNILNQLKKQDQSARSIQLWWRAAQRKRVEQRRHEAAKTIQRAWAAHRQCLTYQQQRKSALLIQCYWRGFVARGLLAALKKRDHSARIIQGAWRRYHRRLIEERQNYAAMVIQHAWKVYRAKQQLAELRKRDQYARKIQRYWRAFQERKQSTHSAAREVYFCAENCIANRTSNALAKLLSYVTLAPLSDEVTALETGSRWSVKQCTNIANAGALEVLIKIINDCNRSYHHQVILNCVLKIVINLCLTSSTIEKVATCPNLVAALITKARQFTMAKKDHEEIFNRILTILYLICSYNGNSRRVLKPNEKSDILAMMEKIAREPSFAKGNNTKVPQTKGYAFAPVWLNIRNSRTHFTSRREAVTSMLIILKNMPSF